MDNKIGDYIINLRKKKGLSQKELGDKLFVSNNTVSKWERGTLLPDIDNIKKLAQVLDTNVESVIYGEEKNKKNKKKKILTIISVIILIILFCISTIFIVKKYYKWSIKNFRNLTGNIQFHGQISTNMEKTIIYFQYLSVDAMHAGTEYDRKIDNYKIQILYEDKILEEYIENEDPPREISKVFEHFTRCFEIDRIDESNYDKLYVNIVYFYNDHDNIYSVKLGEHLR